MQGEAAVVVGLSNSAGVRIHHALYAFGRGGFVSAKRVQWEL